MLFLSDFCLIVISVMNDLALISEVNRFIVFSRATLCIARLCCCAVSVCSSIRLSHAVIVSKRLNLSLKCLDHW